MINLSTLILSVEGPDGLFDIDATLPIVAIQFILLMIILNIILYNPLLKQIEERKEYILVNLGQASDLLAKANNLTTQYEEGLINIQKQVQLEITNSQNINKEILALEILISQKYIDNLLNTITDDFEIKKNLTLNNLESNVKALCNDINIRLSI